MTGGHGGVRFGAEIDLGIGDPHLLSGLTHWSRAGRLRFAGADCMGCRPGRVSGGGEVGLISNGADKRRAALSQLAVNGAEGVGQRF